MTVDGDPGQVGAYGLTFVGGLAPTAGDPLFVDAPDGWPSVTIESAPETRLDRVELTDEVARIRLLTGGWLEATASPLRAVFRRDQRPDRHHLAHPGASAVGSVVSRWLGRETFHGGALVLGGRAWGVLGGKEAGKSTLLAHAALQGVRVVADDLVVVDDGDVLAGPRCVDLRRPSAERIGDDVELTTVRDGERWRLLLDRIPPRVPLAGWILFERDGDVEPQRVPVVDRLAELASHRMIRLAPRDGRPLLDLASLPMYRLGRPRHWGELPATVERLTDVLTPVGAR